MSKPTPPTYITPQTCYNISYFRSILKDLRILEDSLAPKLNATLAVSKTNEDGCKSFVKALSNAYEQRKSLIEYCGTVVGEEVDRLKKMQEEVKGDRKQEAVLKGKVDVEQTQKSMIEREWTVEEILRERTVRTLRDRCRGASLPKEWI